MAALTPPRSDHLPTTNLTGTPLIGRGGVDTGYETSVTEELEDGSAILRATVPVYCATIDHFLSSVLTCPLDDDAVSAMVDRLKNNGTMDAKSGRWEAFKSMDPKAFSGDEGLAFAGLPSIFKAVAEQVLNKTPRIVMGALPNVMPDSERTNSSMPGMFFEMKDRSTEGPCDWADMVTPFELKKGKSHEEVEDVGYTAFSTGFEFTNSSI